MRIVHKDALGLIKRFEGFRADPYFCPAGKLTVGYGHVFPAKEPLFSVTQQEAEILLTQDIEWAAQAVESLVKVSLSGEEFGALVSFVYNVGAGAFKNSTLLRKLNAGDFRGARKEFLRWTKANGRELPGLVTRRHAEAQLFLPED